MFRNEPILYTYFWKGEEPVLESSQRIDLKGFYENEGFEYAQVRYGVLSANPLDISFPSAIESLEKIGDMLLIHYKPGPSNSELRDWEKVNNKEADESLTKAVMEKAKERTVALVNGKVFPVSLPPMFYDSYRVIGSEIWWMKPLSKDKEDESYVVYKGKLQAVD